MESLSPDSFFETKHFKHRSLFDESPFVWEALKKIATYLQKVPLGIIEIPIPQGVTLVDPERISIGKNTVIEPGVWIEGPCIIGDRCSIRHGAYVHKEVIIGSECVIGHATEVKHSILLDRACAPHFNYVGDSILGNRVNLGAGFVCSNFRLDGGGIFVSFRGEKIDTGLRKLGIILGDGASLGCNGVSNPGTFVGKGGKSYPCVHFGGVHPACCLIANSGEKDVCTRM